MTLQSKAEELDDQYNPDGDGEHPTYLREDWRRAVADQDTLFGYWLWVASMLWEEET